MLLVLSWTPLQPGGWRLSDDDVVDDDVVDDDVFDVDAVDEDKDDDELMMLLMMMRMMQADTCDVLIFFSLDCDAL